MDATANLIYRCLGCGMPVAGVSDHVGREEKAATKVLNSLQIIQNLIDDYATINLKKQEKKP